MASRQEATKARYIARLHTKKLVLANFPGASKEELLERMVELTLYVEDNQRWERVSAYWRTSAQLQFRSLFSALPAHHNSHVY